MKNKILIISYTFPPMQGVGGRRWAKLANALYDSGDEVHVIAAQPFAGESSSWRVNEKIIVKRFPRSYPNIITEKPKNAWQKIQYRITLFILKLLIRTNYYDRGVFWYKYFQCDILNYIKVNGIKNVIVTGGPFSFLYYAAKLKEKYPDIKLLIDIRDEWGADQFYGFGLLSSKRKKSEILRIKYALEKADLVTVPYPYMITIYADMINENKDKIKLLAHGVDEVFIINAKQKTQVNKFVKLVNFGSIHSNQEDIMQCLADGINNSTLHLHFYSQEHKYINIFNHKKVLNKNVFYHLPVIEEQVAKTLSISDAALLFIPSHFKNSITTKFMEIVANRTPIVAIGEKGEAVDFIIKNNLGVFIDVEKLKDEFINIPSMLKNLNYNLHFDISPYRFEKQAALLHNYLNIP